jgi:hypothetical protein
MYLKMRKIIRLYKAGQTIANISFKKNRGGEHSFNLYGTNAAHPWAELTYHMEEFPYIIDILRNEKPLYLKYPYGAPSGFRPSFGTSKEPTGEAETNNP